MIFSAWSHIKIVYFSLFSTISYSGYIINDFTPSVLEVMLGKWTGRVLLKIRFVIGLI